MPAARRVYGRLSRSLKVEAARRSSSSTYCSTPHTSPPSSASSSTARCCASGMRSSAAAGVGAVRLGDARDGGRPDRRGDAQDRAVVAVPSTRGTDRSWPREELLYRLYDHNVHMKAVGWLIASWTGATILAGAYAQGGDELFGVTPAWRVNEWQTPGYPPRDLLPLLPVHERPARAGADGGQDASRGDEDDLRECRAGCCSSCSSSHSTVADDLVPRRVVGAEVWALVRDLLLAWTGQPRDRAVVRLLVGRLPDVGYDTLQLAGGGGARACPAHAARFAFMLMYLFFVLVSLVLLINYLIAMLSDTHASQKNAAELTRRVTFARRVLRMELLATRPSTSARRTGSPTLGRRASGSTPSPCAPPTPRASAASAARIFRRSEARRRRRRPRRAAQYAAAAVGCAATGRLPRDARIRARSAELARRSQRGNSRRRAVSCSAARQRSAPPPPPPGAAAGGGAALAAAAAARRLEAAAAAADLRSVTGRTCATARSGLEARRAPRRRRAGHAAAPVTAASPLQRLAAGAPSRRRARPPSAYGPAVPVPPPAPVSPPRPAPSSALSARETSRLATCRRLAAVSGGISGEWLRGVAPALLRSDLLRGGPPVH